ncbi:unnamed protein product [Mortierella alpina]
MSNLTEREDTWYKNTKTPANRTPEAFFLAFGITDKQIGHRRYGLAIERCSTGGDRKRLKEEFDQWKTSKGPLYWTDQQARLSAMRTAGTLIEASEPYAEHSLCRASKMVNAPQEASTATPSAISSVESMAAGSTGTQDIEPSSGLDPHIARARASPFYDLVDYIFKKMQGQDPSLPALPPELSPTHNEMFRMAIQLLQEPGDIAKKKHVLTLVSGIINTLSPVGQQFTISLLVKEKSCMASLSYTSKTVDDLRAELQAALYPDPDDPAAMSVESLQRFVYVSLSQCVGPHPTRAAREKYIVLKIVSQVLHWLENDIFTAPLSEHVFVSAWSDIFNTLFARSGLRSIPGELGSKASRESRFLTESMFGHKTATSTNPRKVDMTIRIFVDKSWADEICIFEFDFYALRRYGDIIGAGRATQEKVWLPSGYNKLDAFLSSRSFEVLLGFRAHMALYAKKATATLASSPATPHSTFPVSEDRSSPITSHSTFTPVAWPPPASTPQTTSSPGSMLAAAAPVSPTLTVLSSPQRPMIPPPRKRDLPFVVFSPSKSQRRGSKSGTDCGGSTIHDDDDLAL